MKHKKLAIAMLIILLAAGLVGATASAADGSLIPRHRYPQPANALLDWQQVNSDGFGDPLELEVSALESFSGYLYAGTHHPVDPFLVYDGGRIFRSPDGVSWTPVTQPGFGDPHDSKPPAILDMAVFNGYLYASTGRGNAAQIWRSWDGVVWAPMVAAGFGDPDTVDITSLVAYNGWIYAGAANQVSGAQIWRSNSGSSGTWTKVAPGVPGMAATRVTGFAEFNSALYAVLESQGSAQIWRSTDGAGWTAVVNNGFGDSNTKMTGGMAAFNGYLYVGAGNDVSGAQLWRSTNGTSWAAVTTPIAGDTNNKRVETVFVFETYLYVSVKNEVTGIEIWRTADGTIWEQVNLDGFGDGNNTGSNRSSASANFLNQFYVGTSNIATGGELWRIVQTTPPTPTDTPIPTATFTSSSVYLPIVIHQP